MPVMLELLLHRAVVVQGTPVSRHLFRRLSSSARVKSAMLSWIWELPHTPTMLQFGEKRALGTDIHPGASGGQVSMSLARVERSRVSPYS